MQAAKYRILSSNTLYTVKFPRPLEIYSRNDIVKFKEKMQSGNAVPLCDITSGVHYHTILAYSDEILDDVAAALKSNGFLLS